MLFRMWLVSTLAISMATISGQARGDTPAAKKPDTTGNAQVAELPAFTPDREAAALEFVAQHHPELSAVLAQLKGLKRDEYEQAIRELAQTREKLATLKQADKDLHGLMLDAWKSDSQIKLLAARLAFAKGPDAALVAELKALLYKQVDLQRQIVEHNHRRAQATLQAMETNIKWLKDNRDQLVERRLQNLTHDHRKSQPKNSAPTSKSKPDKSAKEP